MQEKNDDYLRSIWRPIALPFALSVGGLVVVASASAASGRYLTWLVVLLAMPVIAFALLRAKNRVQRAFLQPNPDALIKEFWKGARSKTVPNMQSWGAYYEAWVYTLYGRFEQARGALERVNWGPEPPIVRGAAKSVAAMICFLDDRDYQQGFNLARSARAEAEASEAFLGVKTALAAHDSLVNIGRILTDSEKDGTVAELEAYAAKAPFGARLMATWGLAVAYAKRHEKEKAESALATCKRLAPHCTPLHSVPESDDESPRG